MSILTILSMVLLIVRVILKRRWRMSSWDMWPKWKSFGEWFIISEIWVIVSHHVLPQCISIEWLRRRKEKVRGNWWRRLLVKWINHLIQRLLLWKRMLWECNWGKLWRERGDWSMIRCLIIRFLEKRIKFQYLLGNEVTNVSKCKSKLLNWKKIFEEIIVNSTKFFIYLLKFNCIYIVYTFLCIKNFWKPYLRRSMKFYAYVVLTRLSTRTW